METGDERKTTKWTKGGLFGYEEFKIFVCVGGCVANGKGRSIRWPSGRLLVAPMPIVVDCRVF